MIHPVFTLFIYSMAILCLGTILLDKYNIMDNDVFFFRESSLKTLPSSLCTFCHFYNCL